VTTNFVWDMHADVNNAGVEEGMRYMGGPLDHALSAFTEDLSARAAGSHFAGGLRRNGQNAADQRQWRPGPLGRTCGRCW
jgi:hypothetical protein